MPNTLSQQVSPTSSPQTQIPVQNISSLVTPKMKKVIIIAGSVVVVLVLLMILAKILVTGKGGLAGNKTTLTPTPLVFNPVIVNPSKYANDANVLKLGDNVNVLNKKITETIISEQRLAPANFQFDIDFGR